MRAEDTWVRRSTAFFCPTDGDRERLLELEETLRTPRLLTYISVAVTLVALGPFVGWWLPLTLGGLSALYELIIRRSLQATTHPAMLIVWGFTMNLIVTSIAAALSGGPQSPLLPWLVIPIIALAGRFDSRGVWWGTGLVALCILAVIATDVPAFLDDPAPAMVVMPLAIALASFGSALNVAELRQRRASALDPLTGLLNRRSLTDRFGELAEQARLSGEPIALIVLDIDHFKRINDEYGHSRGDTVLREIATALRGELRSFELAYRLGGEEFLVVLPAIDVEHGTGVAERLRLRLAGLNPDGVPITASLGVSAGRGEDLEFDALFDAADRALYAAKDAGRDRVCTAPQAAADLADAVA
jgi:diguanylate cyclase (GGDEF)-like protein